MILPWVETEIDRILVPESRGKALVADPRLLSNHYVRILQKSKSIMICREGYVKEIIMGLDLLDYGNENAPQSAH